MKRAFILAIVVLSACSPITSNSTGAAPTPAAVLPSAQAATPDQASIAKQAVEAALKQIRQGQGVNLTGDSYLDSEGAEIPAHLTGRVGPDGGMDLFISVPFSQGTDVFEVRSLTGHEYTWDPSSSSWSAASLAEPAASGISAVNPLFMNYPTLMNVGNVRIAPDDLVNGTSAAVYEVTVTSSDQNDQVTTRLWLAKDSGALLQEDVSLSNQTELSGGLGFNGILLIQFQPSQSPVSVSAPPVG